MPPNLRTCALSPYPNGRELNVFTLSSDLTPDAACTHTHTNKCINMTICRGRKYESFFADIMCHQTTEAKTGGLGLRAKQRCGCCSHQELGEDWAKRLLGSFGRSQPPPLTRHLLLLISTPELTRVPHQSQLGPAGGFRPAPGPWIRLPQKWKMRRDRKLETDGAVRSEA